MAVADNDVLKIAAVMRDRFGSEVVNVFHVQVVAVTVGDDLTWSQAAAEWLRDMYTEIVSGMPPSTTFEEVSVFNLTQSYPLPTVSWDTLTAGTAGSDESLPPGACPLLIGRTGVSNRVAKKYLPATHEGTVTAGRIDDGFFAQMQDFGTEWLTGISDLLVGSAPPCVCNPDGSSPAVIVSTLPSRDLAYQRRRRPGRGS